MESEAGVLCVNARPDFESLSVVSAPPRLFRLAKRLNRSKVRGGYRILEWMLASKRLDLLVQYALHPKGSFLVPLYRRDSWWDERDIECYEKEHLTLFARELGKLGTATMFDCGADIGTFSSNVCAQVTAVRRVIAFEPNPLSFQVLQRNLTLLGCEFLAVHKAVSDFEGTGVMVRSQIDDSDHAFSLVPGVGRTVVTRIDAFSVDPVHAVAIKVDVEGSELEVLRGAAATLAAARACVVSFEAHAELMRRHRRSPIQIMKFLETIRSFQFRIAETGKVILSNDPIFGDHDIGIVNVVATSTHA
jgi:FkbM family methyltransferase